MIALYVALALTGASQDRVTVTLDAVVDPSLEQIRVVNESVFRPAVALEHLEIVLAADRYRTVPEGMQAHHEPELFRTGFEPGGFGNVEIWIDGTKCQPTFRALKDGSRAAMCPGSFEAEQSVRVKMQAVLLVPPRWGPFSRVGRQVTLGGGWYPYVARPNTPAPRGPHTVRVTIPDGFLVAVGSRVWPAVPGRTQIEHRSSAARQVPLVLLPPGSGTFYVPGGRLTSPWRHRPNASAEERFAATLDALEDGLQFLQTLGFERPSDRDPLWLIEAPLRHDLVRVTDGLVIVSDHAFQVTPVERFQRFHRLPVLRGLFTEWALRKTSHRPLGRVEAEAIGAWLLDRFVKAEAEAAEDAFDILQFWSFIPAVDSLLYAPQLPFVDAYFRLIREEDPLRAPFIDFPAPWPRGKVIYEKLLDRLGAAAIDAAMNRMLSEGIDVVVPEAIGEEAPTFLDTWLGSYPAVQYRLKGYDSRPETGPACGESPSCHVAEVSVERTGDVVAEPITVLLEDDDGHERIVQMPAETGAIRTVTATLSAELDFVWIDPGGRLAETPSEAVPSPKFDNRSSAKWRVLLNNFNFATSPTAGTVDTALDLGYSRVRDVRWRFATRAGFAPESLSLSSRALYRFGDPVTPDTLMQWVGLSLSTEYLRPSFAEVRQDALVAGGTLFYGYDDRKTLFMPEAGTAFRGSVSYRRRVFGEPSEAEPDVTQDAVAVSLRVLRSWRFDAAHQISLRGSVGGFVYGVPRTQQQFSLGGRAAVRGYAIDDTLGRWRAIGSAEWVHPILPSLDHNLGWLFWVNRLEGALFADIAWVGDRPQDFRRDGLRADVGYGLRIYLDYFGVRPGVMAVDLAFPLVDSEGRGQLGPPALYIDFAQSFFVF